MKKTFVILTAIASILMVILTSNVVYPTRNEMDGKINGIRAERQAQIEAIKERLVMIQDTLLRISEKQDRILEMIGR